MGTAGSVTFEVYADATKIYDSGAMTGATATKAIDVSIAGAAQLRLVVTNGGDNVVLDHADWAEARIECGSGGGGGDTTPPTITTRTPAAGATGVASAISPTAAFSEAMNPSTLTTSTFTLVQQGQTTPLAATVSYASQVATLDPTANLAANTTYTATVKGGSSGAKDVAGNPLAGDVTWTFTTAAGGNQPPTPVITSPSPTLTWKVGDNISFAGQATDPEQGALSASALSWTLLIQHCPSNCHTHTLQSWPGVASGSFAAPDHEYPSWLELKLTATDAGGASATTTVALNPQDRRSELRVAAHRSPTRSQQHLFGDPVLANRHHRLEQLGQRDDARSLSAEAPMRSRRGRTPAARPTTSPRRRPPRRTPRRTRCPLPGPRPT